MHPKLLLPVLAILVFTANAAGQKKSPPRKKSTPKATAPPAPSLPPPRDDGGSGFKTYTIPVYDRIQLGMKQKDFEAISDTLHSFQTEKNTYKAVFKPVFAEGRLFALAIEINQDSLPAIPVDIVSKFRSKYGEADSFKVTSADKRPAADSAKGSQVYSEWGLQYYKLILDMNITDNGKTDKENFYKAGITIFYRGNTDYLALLQEVGDQ